MSHKAFLQLGKKQQTARLNEIIRVANEERNLNVNIQNIADPGRQSPPVQQAV